jgi:hypothetical protein
MNKPEPSVRLIDGAHKGVGVRILNPHAHGTDEETCGKESKGRVPEPKNIGNELKNSPNR